MSKFVDIEARGDDADSEDEDDEAANVGHDDMALEEQAEYIENQSEVEQGSFTLTYVYMFIAGCYSSIRKEHTVP